MMFRNIKKEKELFERELEQWKNEKRFEAKESVRKFKIESEDEITTLTQKCASDTKKLEHDYHHTQEQLGIEIAKIEAKRDSLKEIAEQDKTTYTKMIAHKDAEIERLNNIIEKIVASQPQTINVHTD